MNANGRLNVAHPSCEVPRAPLEIGVGFWTMQSTYMRPVAPAALYREAIVEARYAEELGFETFWLGEHHFSYDGYCPSPLPTAGMLLASTRRIKVATGVLVLPFHSASRVAQACAALESISPSRARVGVGIGYRELEFTSAGLRLQERAQLTEGRLAQLSNSPLAADLGSTELWAGASAAVGVERAARYGCSMLVVPWVTPKQLPEFRERWQATYTAHRSQTPRFGTMREVWVARDARRIEWARARLTEMWRHYANFFIDDPANNHGKRERAAERFTSSAILGSPAQVIDQLGELIDAGADTLALRVRFDGVPSHAVQECLELLAVDVVPKLREFS